MAMYVMDQGDGSGVQLVGDFIDAAEADLAANALGIFGTPVELTVWELLPAQMAVALECSKRNKGFELSEEARQRVQLVIPGINVEAAVAAALMTNQLNTLGNSVKDVVVVLNTSLAAIAALTTRAAVQSYDVRNDPGWP